MSVKNKQIKLLAKQLIEKWNDWQPDFETNKDLIAKRTTINSKFLRNTLAGYITKKINQEIKRQPLKPKGTIVKLRCKECGHEQIFNLKLRGNVIRCELCRAVIYKGGIRNAEIVEIIK